MLAVTRSVPAPEAVATLRLRGTDSIRDGWVDRFGLDLKPGVGRHQSPDHPEILLDIGDNVEVAAGFEGLLQIEDKWLGEHPALPAFLPGGASRRQLLHDALRGLEQDRLQVNIVVVRLPIVLVEPER